MHPMSRAYYVRAISLIAGILIGGAVVAAQSVFENNNLPTATSVEVGLSEVSPNGIGGGFAIPASGSSQCNFTVNISPTSGPPGTQPTISWTGIYNGLNGRVYRDSSVPWAYLGESPNAITDTGTAGLAPGTYTYSVRAHQCDEGHSGCYGSDWDNSVSDIFACNVEFTVTQPQPPVCNTIATTPNTINSGEWSTLSWTSTGATSASFNNGIGAVSLSGSTSVSPSVNTTYILTLTNSAGSVTCQSGVTVLSVPNLTSSNIAKVGGGTQITAGNSAAFTARANNTTGVDIASSFTDNFAYGYGGAGGSFTVWSSVAAPSGLAGNTSRTDTSSLQPFTNTGTVTIRHCADAGANITETNDDWSDNCSYRDFTVVATSTVVAGCTASPDPAAPNQTVTWTGSASGGTGPYTYQWSGASLSGSGQTKTASYNAVGVQTAQVIATDSAGRSSTPVNCTVSVETPPPPDLVSTSLTLSAGPYTQGAPITVTGIARNIGAGNTGAGFSNRTTYQWGGTSGTWLNPPGNTFAHKRFE
jgi:hypothetical protein